MNRNNFNFRQKDVHASW